MKKWRPYVHFWIIHFILESYAEYVWIQSSLSESSVWEILRIVILTELSFNLSRIPTAIVLSKVLTNAQFPPWKRTLGFLGTLCLGVLFYRFIGVYIILENLYSVTSEEISFFGIASINSAAINVILCSVIYISFVQYRKAKESRRKEELMKQQNLETELKFLKAQLNPHFLFNTLNNLYGLARNHDKRTPEIILQLSDLLRFMLYEANANSISIGNELSLLEKYIALEKIRYSDRLTISFKKNIQDSSFAVAPLLIVHLVENAFKHGISESTKNVFIHIDVSQLEDKCEITIVNTKAQVVEGEREKIGLSNVRRQLDLLYKDFELNIHDNEDIFKLELILPNSLQ